MVARLRPLWPTLAGVAVALVGVLGGFFVSVGQYCAGTFVPQTAAAQQDANQTGHSATHYEAACQAAASQQGAIWGGLIVLGLILAAVALVWRYGRLSPKIRPQARRLLWPACAGGGLLFVAIVGGWAIPVGQDCSGAFGDQDPAKVVAAVTGSTRTLTSCRENAAPMTFLWWALIVIGVGGITLGAYRAYCFLRPGALPRAVSRLRKLLPPKSTALQTSAAPPASTSTAKVHTIPVWPFVSGGIVVLVGIAAGNWVHVGPHCDGAFSSSQDTAVTADLTSYYAGRTTDYTSTCQMLAGQQAGTYWGVIGFGAALLVIGLLLAKLLPLLAATAKNVEFGVAAEVERLAALRESGALSDAEFKAQKGRLLRL